jgi:rhodanese-related sulfurtransferase
LILNGFGLILTPCMRIKRAITQAAALLLLGTAAGLVNNAFSVNGIDPFRRLEEVPVFENGGEPITEADADDHDGICFVNLEEFREMVDAGYPIIDARTSDEYKSGHVPGAILCDYFEMGRYFDFVLPRLDPGDRIGIYCNGPSCDDSEMLGRELYTMGYKKLCVFKGGMEEWREAGLEIEHGAEEWSE